MLRNLLVVGIAACAAACASAGAKPDEARSNGAKAGLTPTQNYKITVRQSPDEILLAAHASGLSQRQTAALEALVGRWRETSGHAVTIKSPAGAHDADRMAAIVAGRLQSLGVAPSLIHQAVYDQATGADAVVAVGFTRYEAEGPKCGRNWEDFTRTGSNTVNSNFGCAITANLAAMIANPADLAEPRPMDDADAGRRQTVLGKYRQGQVTSAAKDDQATGAISSVVH